MNVFDILLDNDLDLVVQHGDLVLGESTVQHQGLLLLSNQGEWRDAPTVGVGLNGYLLDDANGGELRQVVRQQFELDGMRVASVVLDGGMPNVEASYE